MKTKMANYKTQLKAHGASAELTVNSLKSKSQDRSYPAKNVKRPRRAEVNHFPSLPSGETAQSMEQKKKNNRQTIREKIENTFGYR